MKNKLKALLLKLPALLVLAAAFIGSIVVKLNGSYDLPWGSIILLGLIFALYIIGEYFGMKEESSHNWASM